MRVPTGRKENEYFIVDNSKNIERRNKGEQSVFWDDCGTWDRSKNSTPKTYFVTRNDKTFLVVKRKDIFCVEKYVHKKKINQPLEPQPKEHELTVLNRGYATLKKDNEYKRRVSWLNGCSICIVEYIGKFPGRGNHGNRKKGHRDYIRTPADVLEQAGQEAKHRNPSNVYEETVLNTSEITALRDVKQIKNKKYNIKRKEQPKESFNNNFADNIQQLQSLVLNNPFVQQVINCKNKVPSIICYTEAQIQDIKRFCASENGVVLGFDKTFNLSDIYVTVAVFKYLAVRKVETDEHPIFIGPVFFHGSSNTSVYHQFFSDLSRHFTPEEKRRLVIGSDDEKAMRLALKSNFHESTTFVCTRHLKQNVKEYLTNKVGAPKSTRNYIIDQIFGLGGFMSESDSDVIEHKAEILLKDTNLKSTDFDQYLKKRIIPIISANASLPENIRQEERTWTNNNCESVNFTLKVKTNWKQLKLVDLVLKLQQTIDARYKDVKRALYGQGELYLDDKFKHRRIYLDTWCTKTKEDRQTTLKRFLYDHGRQDPKYSTSTDGNLTVLLTPSRGKKPHQTKRKRSEKSRTITKKLKI